MLNFKNVLAVRMITFKTITLTLGLGLIAAGVSGCETSEDRQLASGQACLDAATNAATANSCITIVEGLSSPESYLIRCSANFVAQGFTASRLATSIDKLKNNGGQDQMTGMMAYLVFTNQGPAHTADKAVINCQKSEVKSMLRLATAAQMATTLADVTTINPNSADPAADMAAAINSFVTANDPVKQASLGASAILATQSYCATGSSYETTDVCTALKDAVGNGSKTNAQIGADLATWLKNH